MRLYEYKPEAIRYNRKITKIHGEWGNPPGRVMKSQIPCRINYTFATEENK
jgi:hypothetical protein